MTWVILSDITKPSAGGCRTLLCSNVFAIMKKRRSAITDLLFILFGIFYLEAAILSNNAGISWKLIAPSPVTSAAS